MKRRKALGNVIGVLLLGLLVTLVAELIDRQRQESLRHQQAAGQLQRLSAELEQTLGALMPLADPLAARLAADPQLPEEELRALTEPLLDRHRRLVNIAISRGLRIVHVNPLAGNEAVLGMDFGLRPEMMEGVRRAVARRGNSLAGPLPLLQSGRLGVIVRTPFFAGGADPRSGELLGLISTVIDLQGLLEDSGLYDPELPFALALRGREGLGERGEVFFGDPELFHEADLQREIVLPDGRWMIAAQLKRAQGYPPQRALWLRGGGALLTLGLLALVLFDGRPARGPQWSESMRKVPLRGFLSRRLLMLLLPIIAVQGWLSYQAALSAAEQFQKQLASEIGLRVHDKVAEFFEVPRRVLSFNAEQARLGLLDVAQPEALVGNFLLQLRQQSLLTFLSLGTAEGEYHAASRPPRGEDRALRMLQARQGDGRAMLLYRVDDANRRGSLISRGNAHFDARLRPWFRAARASGSMVWYPAYRYAIDDESGAYDAMGIGMAAPLYGRSGEFLGVLTADVALLQLSQLLADITRHTGGVAFLAEANGDLLATSSREPVYLLRGTRSIRIKASASDNPLVRTSGQAIAEQGSTEGRTFRELDGERYLVDWGSYALPDGPTLTIGVALPQRQFIAPTSGLLRNVTLVALAVLLLSLLGAVLLSNWIAQPLGTLSRWALRLGNGDWSGEKPVDSRVLEVGMLGDALAMMARRLERHTEELRQQVEARTAELERANRELLHLSSTDGLTGLANRRVFDATLAREWGRARRARQPLALLMLDIDFFKRYNDRYGHLAGDDCLRKVAATLQAGTRRAGDLAARYGGEEFAVIASDLDAAGALALAESIRAAVMAQAIAHADSPLGVVTVSMGVALLVPEDDNSPEILIKLADQALYQAKSQGRNRVEEALGNLAGQAQEVG
ncbi:diguanylate cyclase [Geopseudomonas guangdongensis]|uniref:diguanylate cyclase n=1 Tax=Geopseudomonas guangdongensis TaxID=1245526 RepID=A0A1H2I8Z6_9GAMM|nr:diguanylate cyclase [Pseudomonas guangdongensis]SDU40612.1 diguanylate cyclase (GGDEF) domain-containing protein [Pseudomonas guangdongensis]